LLIADGYGFFWVINGANKRQLAALPGFAIQTSVARSTPTTVGAAMAGGFGGELATSDADTSAPAVATNGIAQSLK
jgi:hypothetical protein